MTSFCSFSLPPRKVWEPPKHPPKSQERHTSCGALFKKEARKIPHAPPPNRRPGEARGSGAAALGGAAPAERPAAAGEAAAAAGDPRYPRSAIDPLR